MFLLIFQVPEAPAGASWALKWSSGNVLGPKLRILERLGAILALILGILGLMLRILGLMLAILERLGAILGPSWSLLGLSWGIPGYKNSSKMLPKTLPKTLPKWHQYGKGCPERKVAYRARETTDSGNLSEHGTGSALQWRNVQAI